MPFRQRQNFNASASLASIMTGWCTYSVVSRELESLFSMPLSSLGDV